MAASAFSLLARGLRALSTHPCPVEDHVRADGGGLYPLDLESIGRQFQPGEDGVVMVPGPGGRCYYNPVSASLFALARHTRAHRDEASGSMDLAAFFTQAFHLRASQDEDGGWRYPIPVARYGLTPGWRSAMAQGLAVSVLLRAVDITGEQSYFDAATAARALMLRPLESGGCADYDESGEPFLEKCPCDARCHILNGALYALIGLHELEARTGELAHISAARRLASQLESYDLGYWSRYDLLFSAPATLAYHSLHVSLLKIAAQLFANQAFSSTAQRWRSYAGNTLHRLRAPSCKARFVLGEGRG